MRRVWLTVVGAGLWLLVWVAQQAWRDTRDVQVTSHALSSPSPQSHPVTVVQLSDLHLQQVGEFEQILLSEVRRLDPDLVVLTGDMLDRAQSLQALLAFVGAMGPMPKIAVLGNWEHWSGVDLLALKTGLQAAGGHLLVNEKLDLSVRGRVLQVLGLDDHTAGAPDAGMLATLDPGPSLLLQHSPGWFQTAEVSARPWRASWCLSGHTHGGQIAFLGWPVVLPRGSGNYKAGRYDTPNCPVYVSRGLGTSVLPLRWGSRPELAVFTVDLGAGGVTAPPNASFVAPHLARPEPSAHRAH